MSGLISMTGTSGAAGGATIHRIASPHSRRLESRIRRPSRSSYGVVGYAPTRLRPGFGGAGPLRRGFGGADQRGRMDTSRRQFLKLSTIGGVTGSVLGFDLTPAYAQVRELKIARTTETRSTCPYCSVSCGVIIHTLGDRSGNVKPTVVHVEGDPDHPINQGALCPKGITLKHNIVNDRR